MLQQPFNHQRMAFSEVEQERAAKDFSGIKKICLKL